jgi:putative ABC transport system substrate-binding protein
MAINTGRRQFISALGGAAVAWPLAAGAQPERLRWIGVLMDIYTPADSEDQSRLAAFQEAFQKLGWTVGRNVRIQARWAAGDPNRLRAFAAEPVGITPDVILCMGVSAVEIMQQATRTIPVVFVQTSDPVGSGFVTGLARPGGNITGFTNFEPEMSGKWLGLLKEATPNMSRVAVQFHAETANSLAFLQVIEAVAPSLGVQVTAAHVHDGVEIERSRRGPRDPPGQPYLEFCHWRGAHRIYFDQNGRSKGIGPDILGWRPLSFRALSPLQQASASSRL